MGHCPRCWMEQHVWQCLQMIWLCRGVASQPGAGWAQAGQAARGCPGEAGQEWLADVGKQAGRYLLSPPRARQVLLESHPSTHPGCCSPCSAHLLPHHGLSSAPQRKVPRAHGPALPGPSSAGLVSGSGIMLGWQRPSCPLHWHLQGEGVPNQSGGGCPPCTWCFHVSLVPWHC